MASLTVHLIGGRYDGIRVDLLRTPPRIDVGGFIYERIDDPDTGESLGGYAVCGASVGASSKAGRRGGPATRRVYRVLTTPRFNWLELVWMCAIGLAIYFFGW